MARFGRAGVAFGAANGEAEQIAESAVGSLPDAR